MKIGINNRFWRTMGGGEKHVGRIAQYLSASHEVDLIAVEPFDLDALERRLRLDLSRCRVRLLEGATDAELAEDSASYDLWINSTYLSSLVPKARKSILLVFFPFLDLSLFRLWQLVQVPLPQPLQALVWPDHGFWKSYDLILANSDYTKNWIRRWWRAPSSVLTPPVDLIGFPEGQAKEKKILSVGRFFLGSHSKRHEILVENFRRMCDAGGCDDWEYHLCGGTHTEQRHQEYLAQLMRRAEGYPIFVHPDLGHDELFELYRSSSIFWHATGFGRHETRNPAAFEHFGITTVEAMSAGCVPIVINKAGQREIVHPGENGLLWDTLEEQSRLTRSLMSDPERTGQLRQAAVRDAARYAAPAFDAQLARIMAEAGLTGMAGVP